MRDVFERSRKGDRALLIQPYAPGQDDPEALAEFSELARSAGAQILATVGARIEKPNPALLIGTGKAEEVKQLCELHDADLVLINRSLSPVQERNLEKLLGRRVVDRTSLILDIFALRARSHEGKLQVELAQLKHMATRLVRGWTHLERQRGGAIGLRGPGETQLETDRRLLSKRVDVLQARLAKVEVQQAQMRRSRVRNEKPRVALVGYTNAGKSTLFNKLTAAEVFVADQLFATLDPTVRRIPGLECGEVLLADTVGFVRDLPHDLVAAFRSTLSEAREADLLLHVIDASDPLREERIAQVDAVLAEIGADEIPQLLVLNKIDRIEGAEPRFDAIEEPGRARVWVSAVSGAGIDLLLSELSHRFATERVQGTVRLPSSAGRLRAKLFESGAVRSEQGDEDGWELELDLPRIQAERLCSGEGEQGDLLRQQLLAGLEGDSYNPVSAIS
jgi:GTP-binding protein HflX